MQQLLYTAGAMDFFIVCIGQLNYLYFRDKDAREKLVPFLISAGIRLHRLPPEEMLSVLNFPATKEFQVFHGNAALYDIFRQELAAS